MATASNNNRASLLSGLRTGGVRSASGNIPHTAAPGGSFNIVPRFASQHSNQAIFPEEQDDESDQVLEIPQAHLFQNQRIMPMTAAVDGPNNRFMQQQRGMNPNSVPFSPAYSQNMAAPANNQQAAIQMQMMQMEILRIQSIQAQQYQAELLAQAQRQQAQAAQQAQNRRASANFIPPATAGPLSNSFDLRSATLSAQMRRAANQQGLSTEADAIASVPMTAALNGRFGTRAVSGLSTTNTLFEDYDQNPAVVPPTPNSTTVISGGTSLGKPSSNNINASAPVATLTKSDSSSSWRRGGNNNSVLSGLNRAVSSSPSVKITPPPADRKSVSPPPRIATNSAAAENGSISSPTTTKARPIPLRFNMAASNTMLPTVSIEAEGQDNASSSGSSNNNSPPTTPRSASSSNDVPLSPREEAAKKLYEGLGIGRPAPPVVSIRITSLPTRQPRGPPSGADELGPKNFATRIRRQAIGGLGVLMGARERRDFVQVF